MFVLFNTFLALNHIHNLINTQMTLKQCPFCVWWHGSLTLAPVIWSQEDHERYTEFEASLWISVTLTLEVTQCRRKHLFWLRVSGF